MQRIQSLALLLLLLACSACWRSRRGRLAARLDWLNHSPSFGDFNHSSGGSATSPRHANHGSPAVLPGTHAGGKNGSLTFLMTRWPARLQPTLICNSPLTQQRIAKLPPPPPAKCTNPTSPLGRGAEQ
uniref:Secreted protein n=1 Tax=Coccidioides posadasii RMSCC 3488 TaxID=454284 RepID=A0A0J6F916_COCPO|nr:hypothetical protein CPAG_03011 [Coccidioides posadasii RMSCC 3488]